MNPTIKTATAIGGCRFFMPWCASWRNKDGIKAKIATDFLTRLPYTCTIPLEEAVACRYMWMF